MQAHDELAPSEGRLFMADTLLIVDDEKGLRELISEFLSDEGYKCLVAGSARQAIDLAKEYIETTGPIRLIISDLNMPGGSGLDMLKGLRALQIQTPVLYLSGDVADSELKPYLSMGVLGYHLKPFRSDEFLVRLSALLAKNP